MFYATDPKHAGDCGCRALPLPPERDPQVQMMTHSLSEILDDAAPLNERRFLFPAQMVVRHLAWEYTRNQETDAFETYNETREKIVALVRKDCSLMGEYDWLRWAIQAEDITLTRTPEGYLCHGHAWTQQTGGSNEWFEFIVPLNALEVA